MSDKTTPKIGSGVITALVTPFDEHGQLALDKLEILLQQQLAAGVHGVFVCGSTGEAYALDYQEKKAVLQATVEFCQGRTQVYFGAGANSLREALSLAHLAEDCGADAITVIPPYFVPLAPHEMVTYFTAIKRETALPMVLYNHPLRTGAPIPADVVARLAKVQGVAGIKDSSGSLSNNIAYLQAAPNLAVLSGNDGLILSLLQMGGAGAVSASANFAPELILGIYHSYCRGDFEKARCLQMKAFKLRQAFILGTYPAMIKEAMQLLGADGGKCRAPVQGLSESQRETLRELLDSLAICR